MMLRGRILRDAHHRYWACHHWHRRVHHGHAWLHHDDVSHVIVRSDLHGLLLVVKFCVLQASWSLLKAGAALGRPAAHPLGLPIDFAALQAAAEQAD